MKLIELGVLNLKMSPNPEGTEYNHVDFARFHSGFTIFLSIVSRSSDGFGPVGSFTASTYRLV